MITHEEYRIELAWGKTILAGSFYSMYTSDESLSNRNFLQVVFSPTTLLFDKQSSEVYIQQLG